MSGNLFIVSAPSGAGKTTLVRGLLQEDPLVHLSVSYSTRAPRQGEIDGREYHFVDLATFQIMKERGDFLEWAQVHGNFYGTSRVWIEEQMAQGRDILLEIDWQGACQVRKSFPTGLGIFILPPSLSELENRLTGRGTDHPEVIARRLSAAQEEMSHVDDFEYAIINNELRVAVDDLCAVVRSARLLTAGQRVRHSTVFSDLLAGQA
jgi:guanylate kinase